MMIKLLHMCVLQTNKKNVKNKKLFIKLLKHILPFYYLFHPNFNQISNLIKIYSLSLSICLIIRRVIFERFNKFCLVFESHGLTLVEK